MDRTPRSLGLNRRALLAGSGALLLLPGEAARAQASGPCDAIAR